MIQNNLNNLILNKMTRGQYNNSVKNPNEFYFLVDDFGFQVGDGLYLANGTLGFENAYGDIVNPYGIKTKNYVLAAPNGSNGVPSFRALAAADLPTVPVTKGGTGLTTMTYKNAVPIGNSTTVTSSMQAIRTASGAFYATAQDGKPTFGTLPVGQGGTGVTTFTSGEALIGNGTNAITTRSITNITSLTPRS